jgi:hypothetical protein
MNSNEPLRAAEAKLSRVRAELAAIDSGIADSRARLGLAKDALDADRVSAILDSRKPSAALVKQVEAAQATLQDVSAKREGYALATARQLETVEQLRSEEAAGRLQALAVALVRPVGAIETALVQLGDLATDLFAVLGEYGSANRIDVAFPPANRRDPCADLQMRSLKVELLRYALALRARQEQAARGAAGL